MTNIALTPLLALDPGYGQAIAGTSMIYWILFIGTMLLSFGASMLVKWSYSKNSKVQASSGLTGAQIAQRILDANDIHDVSIHSTPGHLTDHYDPSHRRLVLSEENYHGTSVAALGVSAHECGHAIQHKMAYAPLQWRMAAVGATNIASQMLYWVPLISLAGYFLHIALPLKMILTVMTLAFGVLMLFQLVTLPVEFDATRRAKAIVGQMGAVAPGAETRAMNSVLNAAALTYVAAFITALAHFLYYLWRMQSSRN
jgi:uncharacterized protein